jgi:hypothetical protein
MCEKLKAAAAGRVHSVNLTSVEKLKAAADRKFLWE